MDGFIVINKPTGLSSQSVVSKVKHKLGVKKVGHLGTLDPMGAGLLVVAVGKGTKFFNHLLEKQKRYRAVFTFGTETDTLDAEGVITKTVNNVINLSQINNKLHEFIGEYDQYPPKYSAKSINGKRAYELAREGVDFELKPKRIKIYDIKCLCKIAKNSFLFDITCSSGTYIRSICRDLAYSLGTVGYMPLIVRISMGNFNINQSISLEEFLNSDNCYNYILPVDECVKLHKIILDEHNVKKVINGVPITIDKPNGIYYTEHNNELISVGKVTNGILKMEILLHD